MAVLEAGVLAQRDADERRVGVAARGRVAGQPSRDPQHPGAQRASRAAARELGAAGVDLRSPMDRPSDRVDDGHVGRRPVRLRGRAGGPRAAAGRHHGRYRCAHREKGSVSHGDETPPDRGRFPATGV